MVGFRRNFYLGLPLRRVLRLARWAPDGGIRGADAGCALSQNADETRRIAVYIANLPELLAS